MASASSGGSLISKIGSYLQIVTKDPSSTAFVPLAEAYRQIGLLDDALEAARLGTRMLPHFSPGFSTMGRVLGQMGRIDEAMSAYARALSIDRQSQSALVGLARLHLVRGERDQARRVLKQAEEFHPDDEKIVDMLNALDLPRPWAEIKQASQIQKIVDQEEAEPQAQIAPIHTATLAEIYVKQGLLDQAVTVYQEILTQNPANDAARERLLQLKPLVNSVPDGVSAENASSVTEMDRVAPQGVTSVQSEPSAGQALTENRSVLTVLKCWLAAINQRRANV